MKHNQADRYEGHQCSDKCARGTEKFCGIDLSAGVTRGGWVKSQRRNINSQVKPNRAANHHDEQESLGSQRRYAGPDMDGNKQSACRSGHCKPNAFQDVGGFSYAELHS